MPPQGQASSGAVLVAVVLGAVIALVWLALLPGLSSLSDSDAAGNAMSQAFVAIGMIFLWVLLGGLVLLACLKGRAPPAAAVAALILVPISGYVALLAADLLARPEVAPFRWPLIIPALVPPLLVAFAIWALLPQLHEILPPLIAAGSSLGAILIVCALIVPLVQARQRVAAAQAAEQEKYYAEYAKLAADAPLWEYARFLDTRNEVQKEEVLKRMRALARRQADAEVMLERGDFPLGFLGRLDLDPTPELCEKARGLLRQRVEPLVLKTPQSKPYLSIFWDVADALAAMRWLVGYDCSCDAESLAWENMAKGYRDPNYDLVELRQLRDPKELGGLLRENPARFSMLSGKSHLKAWLHFADNPATREQAIAGARKLEHRTTDAVEMMNGADPSGPYTVLRYMPLLDFEPTPALCTAALGRVRDDLMKVYHPRPDDPRPYRELLDRLGAYEPLAALQWLAGNGCNAEAELTQAEAVIGAYQDSPARAAMLASLARLHRRP